MKRIYKGYLVFAVSILMACSFVGAFGNYITGKSMTIIQMVDLIKYNQIGNTVSAILWLVGMFCFFMLMPLKGERK